MGLCSCSASTTPGWHARWLAAALGLLLLLTAGRALAAEAAVVHVVRSAAVLEWSGDELPAAARGTPLALPDEWSVTRPRYDGTVTYRTRFDLPPGTARDALLALYIERACSNLEVQLNDHRIHSGGDRLDAAAANCRHSQLVPLPAALLQPQGNALELHLTGRALEHVASRDFAAGLSTLRIGAQDTLARDHARSMFWNVNWVQASGVMLAVLGTVMLILGWQHPQEVYFGYFGSVCIGWAVLSIRLWIHETWWPQAASDYLFCIGMATLVGLAIQFMLSYAGLRSRFIEAGLVLQWLLVPLSLLVGGEYHLFTVANVWYLLFAAELFAVAGIYLNVTWRERRHDFTAMAGVLAASSLLILAELGNQHALLEDWPYVWAFPLLPVLMPLLFVIVGVRLLLIFTRALRNSESARIALTRRVRELTTEFEGNFSQLAELRVEQVTEKERKRIAADLHDDLGAKLLTIVHTSGNERISELAREALEDMRLSVKGLIGKPMRLADALADWRAETVSRLNQAGIEADWQSPPQETDHLLPSRTFVQATRIVREAVSNVVKHSQASHCNVRCRVEEGHFALTLRDNGRGIPSELEGKLDRGLGMSSMKRRAKLMQGQCLVQSGPGFGTVIALTVPL